MSMNGIFATAGVLGGLIWIARAALDAHCCKAKDISACPQKTTGGS